MASAMVAYDIGAGFPAVHVPEQKPPPPQITPAEARVALSCYPPLSQVTVVDATPGNVDFVIGLHVHPSRARSRWQVALSLSSLAGPSGPHGQLEGEEPSGSSTGGPLETLLDANISSMPPLTLLQSADAALHFTLSAAVSSTTRFTAQYRESSEEPWRSAREEFLLDDGIVVLKTQQRSPAPGDLGHVIQGLNPALVVHPAASQSPGTSLWVIEAPVAGVAGDDRSVFAEVEVGLPWAGFLRWFSLARTWSPWVSPMHGRSDFSSMDRDAVLCSFLGGEGRHLVLLAVSGSSVSAVLRSNSAGRVVVRTRSDSIGPSTATVLAAIGDAFENTVAAVMYHARLIETETLQAEAAEPTEPEKHGDAGVRPEWLENWYDGLGFCTWNALGQRLTEEKLVRALEILAANKVLISNLIIDDNWQNIDYRGSGQFQYGWNDFEAEPKAFPRGLRETVATIRAKHPEIQHVAVWHALLGYWGGISPDGRIARSYKTVEAVREDAKRRNLPLGGRMTAVAKDDVPRFFDDFYRFLSSCGVDAVKTDAQFMVDTWIGAETRRDLAPTYLTAWAAASLRHFGPRAISCMSHTPVILFRSLLPRNRPPVVLRTSDDFLPDIPSSHPWHVWTNAHNMLMMQHLNIVPDWDMFQTTHAFSGFHAAARAVSGGPIYITDVPGEHDVDLIARLTGVTPRGRTVIFRPSVPGKSIDHYVSYTDDSLLKIGSYHGTGSTGGTSMLGVFNTSSRPLVDIVPLARFPGVQSTARYVVRSHRSGRATLADPSALLSISLGVREYDIWSAFPLSTFAAGGRTPVSVANLGLAGKLAGAAAVISSEMECVNGRIVVDIRIKALGVLGIFVSTLPEMVAVDNILAVIQGAVIPPSAVAVSAHDDRVLELDIEAAWKQMRLDSGWSNEVQLKVYVNV